MIRGGKWGLINFFSPEKGDFLEGGGLFERVGFMKDLWCVTEIQ